ncbi:MAG: hypothetical protein WCS94_22315, partial [Verrucomicrobiota bacterium]
GQMRNVFGEPAYAQVQTNLMQEVFRLRDELKEPAHDDPKAFGNPAVRVEKSEKIGENSDAKKNGLDWTRPRTTQ